MVKTCLTYHQTLEFLRTNFLVGIIWEQKMITVKTILGAIWQLLFEN